MTYRRLLMGAYVLGRKFVGLAGKGEGVGILLPNSHAVAANVFGLLGIDRVAVLLNFSAGATAVVAAIRISTIRSVVTSRRFVELARLEGVIEEISSLVEVVYLEDVRESISFFDRLRAFLAVRLRAMRMPTNDPDSTAVIVFTSGSEGMPKGVALSHRNLLANVYQAIACADIHAGDRLLNPLPVFHCFGLMAGLLLPLYAGVRSLQYPTPLAYRQIAELIYQWRPTILFGANSFLAQYGRVADSQDMASLRYVFAGAEQLRDETYDLWFDKFGIQIMQGYGVSEASPVIAVNTRSFHRYGSVGVPLPGIELRLQRLEEFPEPDVGVLEVRGSNVMQGYIFADAPGEIIPPEDGWYNTGDIVRISWEGFISILGRKRRFAKVGGEMVGLDLLEVVVDRLWPEERHGVVARPVMKRGEVLVLFSERAGADLEAIRAEIQARGLSLLLVPAEVRWLAEVPTLGSGKVDYVRLQAMV